MLPDDTWEKANSGREKLHVSLWEKETTLVEKTTILSLCSINYSWEII